MAINDYVGQQSLIGAGIGGIVGGAVGLAVGYSAGKRVRKKRTKRKTTTYKNRKKRNSTRKSKGKKLKFGSPAYRKKYLKQGRRRKQKQPHTAGKRKDTSRRRIRYTKNNQPYVILASGKARFISKKSASSSKKRKGGKY